MKDNKQGNISMYFTIYKISNKVNDKIYIGKHKTSNLKDTYLGSGKLIQKAIKKYGKENFEKEILFIFDNEFDMNNKEKELITEEFCLQENVYNISPGGQGGALRKGFIQSTEIKNKISNSLKGKYLGVPKPKYMGEKISNIQKGRKHSLERCQNISNSLKGKKRGKQSLEHKTKRLLATSLNNNGFKGMLNKKHTEESKAKISNANSKKRLNTENMKKPKNKASCLICKKEISVSNINRHYVAHL